ncbi:hypothetical protein RUM43_000645 [Polyplax serrata]|uniref:Uncharacterized protein n=1 Tax=Polyplax serrata TaxID=468196 RepID=A0AAN8XNE6_POLSC
MSMESMSGSRAQVERNNLTSTALKTSLESYWTGAKTREGEGDREREKKKKAGTVSGYRYSFSFRVLTRRLLRVPGVYYGWKYFQLSGTRAKGEEPTRGKAIKGVKRNAGTEKQLRLTSKSSAEDIKELAVSKIMINGHLTADTRRENVQSFGVFVVVVFVSSAVATEENNSTKEFTVQTRRQCEMPLSMTSTTRYSLKQQDTTGTELKDDVAVKEPTNINSKGRHREKEKLYGNRRKRKDIEQVERERERDKDLEGMGERGGKT